VRDRPGSNPLKEGLALGQVAGAGGLVDHPDRGPSAGEDAHSVDVHAEQLSDRLAAD
jgi:hypothetical protein